LCAPELGWEFGAYFLYFQNIGTGNLIICSSKYKIGAFIPELVKRSAQTQNQFQAQARETT